MLAFIDTQLVIRTEGATWLAVQIRKDSAARSEEADKPECCEHHDRLSSQLCEAKNSHWDAEGL